MPMPNRPPTSTAAHRRSLHAAENDRARILDLLRERPEGMTDYEIQEATGIIHQTVSPRRGELVRMGLVVDGLKTRPTDTGSPATVWVLAAYLRGACRHCHGSGCFQCEGER